MRYTHLNHLPSCTYVACVTHTWEVLSHLLESSLHVLLWPKHFPQHAQLLLTPLTLTDKQRVHMSLGEKASV